MDFMCRRCGETFSVPDRDARGPVKCPACGWPAEAHVPKPPERTARTRRRPIRWRALVLPAAALVLAGLGFVPLFGVGLGFIGMVLGYVLAKRKWPGKPVSLAAMLLGAAAVAVMIHPTIRAWRARLTAADRAQCQANLRRIESALRQYHDAWDGGYPTDLTVLLAERLVQRGDLTCPAADGKRRIDYFYLRPPLFSKPPTYVACDYAGNHDFHGRNVILSAGGVDWVDEDDFQEELQQPKNAAFAATLFEVDDR